MIEFEFVCKYPQGIHARPAALLANSLVNFRSSVTFKCHDKSANGNNVLQVISLGINYGDNVRCTIEGSDEEECYEKVKHYLVDRTYHNFNTKPLKIAFFGTKGYDKTFFMELADPKDDHDEYNVDITYLETRLTKETVKLAKGYEAICIFVNDECGSEVVEKLHEYNIGLILLRCAGFNNVDLNLCEKYGIKVLRVPAYSPYAVAEHAMAIIQQANRRLHKSYNKIRENNFDLTGLLGTDLHNKTAGIIGTGKIGQCMAQICKGYGMNVIGWDAYPNPKLEEEGLLKYVDKEELYKKADLISLHAPLVKGENGTYHLIDEKAISLMKDDVMLVNTARGALIDDEALIVALKKGKFHAVALDVYEGEDSNVYTNLSDEIVNNDITGRLLMFPQVVITSHQAFFTREALQAIAVVTMENARNYIENKDFGAAEVKAK